MKSFFLCSLMLGLLLCLTPSGNAATNTDHAAVALSKLQALIGEWQGKLPDGNDIRISYEQINGGAILERYRSTDPIWWNMSTMYHQDNQTLIMSHYCSWGNHPRMSAVIDSPVTKTIDFQFIDLSHNEPDNGYMRDFDIEFIDVDQVIHYWHWREDGKDTPLTLKLKRVK
ncbi:MAG: hypothetical protein Tsb002_18340 [Wenzhouxiangellaceae bacterium]